MNPTQDLLTIPLREIIKQYLYGEETKKGKWLTIAQRRPDYREFQQRVNRVLS